MSTENHNPENRANDQGKDNNLNRFIRVGHDYFEIFNKPDRYGILRIELKVRKKSELLFDFDRDRVRNIKKFDDFILVPDNINYQQSINNCFNRYQPFNHIPLEGEWLWTKRLLEHVFGDQYDLGIKYIQALYQEPTKILPILVLVSALRQTGKSTFIDWLTVLFGGNMVIIDSKHLSSSFNSSIAYANIIAIEEAFIEKSATMEVIKALSTQKTITINEKYIPTYTGPFYGKIILASNNENKFIKIDKEEIRFFIRKLSKPKFKNHNILEVMRKEIPAFLNFLNQQDKLSWENSRQLFTADELRNDTLMNVQNESKNWLYHELYELFVNEFNNVNPNEDFYMMTLTEIKEKWFKSDNKINRSFIKAVLKDDFGFQSSETTTRYNDQLGNSKVGKPYFILREYFNNDVTETRPIEV